MTLLEVRMVITFIIGFSKFQSTHYMLGDLGGSPLDHREVFQSLIFSGQTEMRMLEFQCHCPGIAIVFK